MIASLATVAIAAQLILVAGDKVPQFDVPSCREAERLDPTEKNAVQNCTDNEAEARRQLQGQWLSFPAGDRRTCAAEALNQGLPSYVELLVCLQDAKVGRELEAKSKL